MKWRIAGVVTVLAAAGLTVSVALGVWGGTQTASGTVNATTDSPDLYLCEPAETGVGCGPDDSGADEIIFEGLEDMLPSSAASSRLRLRNAGANPMDVLSAVPAVAEVADPDNDCEAVPDALIRVLGKIPYVTNLWQNVYDNHGNEFADAQGLQIFPRAIGDPQYLRDDPWHGTAVHIEPGDYEDFRVEVILLTTLPAACEENVWDITIAWNVVSVGHSRAE
jgi:hypothetical protein